jgi:hypothetical protein
MILLFPSLKRCLQYISFKNEFKVFSSTASCCHFTQLNIGELRQQLAVDEKTLNSFLNDIYCKHLFKDGNNKIIENWFEFIRKPSALPIPEVN